MPFRIVSVLGCGWLGFLHLLHCHPDINGKDIYNSEGWASTDHLLVLRSSSETA